MKAIRPHIETKKLLLVTVVWVIVAQVLFLLSYLLMLQNGVNLDNFQFPSSFILYLIISALLAFLGGKFMLYLCKRCSKKRHYKVPVREERIFMFLDLRSSTSIAEQIGEEMYFNFLRDVFEKTTPCIVEAKGEIYQYVGDEIVISWPLSNGLDNANCIRCFFNVQKCLAKQHDFYLKKYGVVPEFKAGVHYGHVMTGEIGVIKREVAFSGDVLNTTSRIEGKCNELGVNILLSEFLLIQLKLSSFGYIPKRIGEMLLRGKKERVVLYTI